MPKISKKIYRNAKSESNYLIKQLNGCSNINETLHQTNNNSVCFNFADKRSNINENNDFVNACCSSAQFESFIESCHSDSEEFECFYNNVDTDSNRDSDSLNDSNLDQYFENGTSEHSKSTEKHDEIHVEEMLMKWAILHNIKHGALSDLLKLLKPFPQFQKLPSDARSLLSTPRNIELKSVSPGQYFHFGLGQCLMKLLQGYIFKTETQAIEVCINIDGLPICKSSGSQLYPILCSLFGDSKVDAIGIYHGNEKPTHANDFLKDFVNEAIHFTVNGFMYNNHLHNFRIKAFICDAPAKSFITYVKGHTGYSSCTKCHQKGVYLDNRICFPDFNDIRLRTDVEFSNKIDEDYHLTTGPSVLETIPGFQMMSGFPLDYMHLICLGVVRKLILLWCVGKPKTKLSFQDTSKISSHLSQQIAFLPSEFSRKPRSLGEVRRWKATELRQFVLYTGPVVLKNILNNNRYFNFLSLHIACRILISENLRQYIDYAENLLKYFVQTFIAIYGKQYVSHNIHNLLHVSADVRKYGALDTFSAYKFENFMRYFKKSLRKTDKPLSQIVYRKFESDNVKTSFTKTVSNDTPLPSLQHNRGPLTEENFVCQYKQVRFNQYVLKIKEPDNCCCLLDGTIFIVKNFAQNGVGQLIMIGHKFENIENFYTNPCDSSEFDTFLVTNPSSLQAYNINEVDYKCVRLKISDYKFVVFPLLHTKD